MPGKGPGGARMIILSWLLAPVHVWPLLFHHATGPNRAVRAEHILLQGAAAGGIKQARLPKSRFRACAVRRTCPAGRQYRLLKAFPCDAHW